MRLTYFITTISFTAIASTAAAQDQTQLQGAVDCTLPENAALEACLNLPQTQNTTNYTPIIAGVAVLAGAAAALSSGGSGSTPDTN